MSIPIREIADELSSRAQRLGYFDNVQWHEPRSLPRLGSQINLAFWSEQLQAVQSSGLSSLSVRWEVTARVYVGPDSEPGDDIEPRLVEAGAALYAALSSGFSFGGRVRHVDFLGSDGEPLILTPGWYDYGNDNVVRTMDLSIPLIINDAFDLQS